MTRQILGNDKATCPNHNTRHMVGQRIFFLTCKCNYLKSSIHAHRLFKHLTDYLWGGESLYLITSGLSWEYWDTLGVPSLEREWNSSSILKDGRVWKGRDQGDGSWGKTKDPNSERKTSVYGQ